MNSFKLALTALVLVGCGVSGRGIAPLRLDGGTADLGACRGESFACTKPADCCGGLSCTGNVCTNPAAVDMRVAAADMSMQANKGIACGALLTCVNNCKSQQCVMDCFASASMLANQLFDDAYVCIFGDMNGGGACPSSKDGVCDSNSARYVQANCDACLQKAQSPGGRCYNQLIACVNDCNTSNDCDPQVCPNCTCSDHVCK